MIEQSESALPLLNLVGLQKLPWDSITVAEQVGEGGYGVVFRGQWSGIEVAIKQLYLKSLSQHLLEEFENESKVMAKCQFPNVVRLYGVCAEIGHYAMVMEYMAKGSLYQVLHNTEEALPWNPVRWQIAIDMGKGLAYLHGQQVLHRDLKSLNVLLDEHYRTKNWGFWFVQN